MKKGVTWNHPLFYELVLMAYVAFQYFDCAYFF